MKRRLIPARIRLNPKHDRVTREILARIEKRFESMDYRVKTTLDMVNQHRLFLREMSERDGKDYLTEFAVFYLKRKSDPND